MVKYYFVKLVFLKLISCFKQVALVWLALQVPWGQLALEEREVVKALQVEIKYKTDLNIFDLNPFLGPAGLRGIDGIGGPPGAPVSIEFLFLIVLKNG